jgi:hypothetical protein
MFTEPNISPVKRACVDRTDQLLDGQLGGSPETGFEEIRVDRLLEPDL